MEIAAGLVIIMLRDLGAVGPLAGRQVGFAADNRLDPVLPRFEEKFDRSEHVAMVGHRDRGHPGLLGVIDQRANFVGAIEQAVLGMDVQMDETHRYGQTSSANHPSSKSA